MFKNNKILSLIIARSGSKGLKNKNVKLFNDKPMVYWSIKASKKSNYVDHTLVSSDSKKVISIAKKNNVSAPFIRPPNLARDNSPVKDVIFHAVDWLRKENKKFDFLLLLQATSPLRTNKHIDCSIRYYFRNAKSLNETLVSVTDAPSKTGLLMKKKKQIYRIYF